MNELGGHARNAHGADDERAGCLSTLGVAIGTWIISVVIVGALAITVNTIPASRVGQVMGVVFLLHLIGFAASRGFIRRGAQLRRIGAVVIAIEVGLAVLGLLLAAVTPG